MKNPFKLLLTILIFISCAVQAQQSGAIMSGNKFLVPRVTRAGITAPQYGWLIYDTIARHYYGYAWPGVWLNLDSNTTGGAGSETDPIFMASAAHTITSTNISNWNAVYNWYNTNGWNSYSPSSFVPIARTITINGITYDLSANRSWTVTSVSETDPVYTANGVPKSRILTINGVFYDLSQNRTWTIPDPPNINIGNGFRVGEVGTNNLKTLVAGNGVALDTIINPNSITITIPALANINSKNADSLGGKPASAYELIMNKVTTLDNSTTHYPSTSAVTTALDDTAAAIRNDFPSAGDTSVFSNVIDSTGQTANRVLVAKPNNKIGSDSTFNYNFSNRKLVINNKNTSFGGSAKLAVNGNIFATSFIKNGGISSQFLKADGSVDANSYYLASNPSGFISSYTETDPLYTSNGVPKTRTITINGTTLDLSANRSWTISTGSSAYASLSDVNLTSLADGQLSKYNATSLKWENFSPSYATLTGTETLTNKTLTSPLINVGSDATGDTYYRNSAGQLTRVPIGTPGQAWTVSGAGIPQWGGYITQDSIILRRNGLGAYNIGVSNLRPYLGLSIENTTAATSILNQQSGVFQLAANGWNLSDGTSQPLVFAFVNTPMSAATGVGSGYAAGSLIIKSNATGSNLFKLSENGAGFFNAVVTASGFSTSGGVNASSSQITNALGAAQLNAGTVSSATQTYKPTNAGSPITPSFTAVASTSLAGDASLQFDKTNGLGFGQRNRALVQIQAARIHLGDTSSLTGNEAAGLCFATQKDGGAAVDRMFLKAYGYLQLTQPLGLIGSTPSYSLGSNVSTASFSSGSNDAAGLITVTTSASISDATIATISFSSALANSPRIMINAGFNTSSGLSVYEDGSATNTSFIIKGTLGTGTYKIKYWVTQ